MNRNSLHRVNQAHFRTVLFLLGCLSSSYAFSTFPQGGVNLNEKHTYLERDDLQVLKFIDPESKRPIILVGCMHYNPESIKRASTVTKYVADSFSSFSLHALLIESCQTRYSEGLAFSKTLESKPFLKEIYQRTLNNEMRSACMVAKEFDRPIILGDRLIDSTSERIGESFKQTISDLTNPLNGGWDAIVRDLKESWKVLKYSFGVGEEDGSSSPGSKNVTKKEVLMLNPDFLDTKLGIGMLVSMLRYPLSIALRYPLFAFGLITFAILGTFSFEIDFGAIDESETLVSQSVDWLLTVAFAILEAVIFARVLVLPVLGERDIVLADAIMAVANGRDVAGSKGEKLMMVTNGEIKPFSSWEDSKINNSDETCDNDQRSNAVVAILGMAHCNGVKRRILESSSTTTSTN